MNESKDLIEYVKKAEIIIIIGWASLYPDLIIDTSLGGKYQNYDAKQIQFQKTLQTIWVGYRELLATLQEDLKPLYIECDPYKMN